VWGSRGAGEQGGFKEVFLSFIAGGVPPVRLLVFAKRLRQEKV